MTETLPPDLRAILQDTPELARAYLVGGCVRDWLLGIPHTDFDIEVFGLGYEDLARALARWGKVDLVGRSFGVVKLSTSPGTTYDFSIPRRDSKTAAGHKGFHVKFDASLKPEEAAARRDFTINSLMVEAHTGNLLDFFGGEADLKNRVLRHSSAAFPEDPLRVLRGMQFAARFRLTAADETITLARSIKHTCAELAKERVREEWFKWAEKCTVPSMGLRFLAATEWIENFPELNALRGVPQDPEWHPEGDVWVHTLHCCDAMAELPAWRNADLQSRIVLMLAVLAHDVGKAITTVEAMKRGELRIVSPGHEEAGGAIAELFLERINAPRAITERILPLIVNHMARFEAVSDRAVRRLAKRLEPENIRNLITLMIADSFGRPPLPQRVPDTVAALARKAEELAVQEQPPTPILLGRHLIEFGFNAGPALGALLQEAYEAQLAGQITDLPSALAWATDHPQMPTSTAEVIRSRLQS